MIINPLISYISLMFFNKIIKLYRKSLKHRTLLLFTCNILQFLRNLNHKKTHIIYKLINNITNFFWIILLKRNYLQYLTRLSHRLDGFFFCIAQINFNTINKVTLQPQSFPFKNNQYIAHIIFKYKSGVTFLLLLT